MAAELQLRRKSEGSETWKVGEGRGRAHARWFPRVAVIEAERKAWVGGCWEAPGNEDVGKRAVLGWGLPSQGVR